MHGKSKQYAKLVTSLVSDSTHVEQHARKRILCQEYGCNNCNVGYLTTSRMSLYPILQIPENKEECKKEVENFRNASVVHHLRNAGLDAKEMNCSKHDTTATTHD